MWERGESPLDLSKGTWPELWCYCAGGCGRHVVALWWRGHKGCGAAGLGLATIQLKSHDLCVQTYCRAPWEPVVAAAFLLLLLLLTVPSSHSTGSEQGARATYCLGVQEGTRGTPASLSTTCSGFMSTQKMWQGNDSSVAGALAILILASSISQAISCQRKLQRP